CRVSGLLATPASLSRYRGGAAVPSVARSCPSSSRRYVVGKAGTPRAQSRCGVLARSGMLPAESDVPLLIATHERLADPRIELASRCRGDSSDRLVLRQRASVGAIGRHCMKGIT